MNLIAASVADSFGVEHSSGAKHFRLHFESTHNSIDPLKSKMAESNARRKSSRKINISLGAPLLDDCAHLAPGPDQEGSKG
jgi:hypothetical protein